MAWATTADLVRYWPAHQVDRWDAGKFEDALATAEREARSMLARRYAPDGNWRIPESGVPELLVEQVCALAAVTLVRHAQFAMPPEEVATAIKEARKKLDRIGRGFDSLGLEGNQPMERTRSRALALRGHGDATFTREKLKLW